MTTFIPMLQREFPASAFAPLLTYRAVIPIQTMRLDLEVHERQKLSLMAQYAMKAVALGDDTPTKVAHFLGLDKRDLAVAVAELYEYRYLEWGPPVSRRERRFGLTADGRQALISPVGPVMPKRMYAKLQFDRLTGRFKPFEDGLWTIDDLEREGLLHILPHPALVPTDGTIVTDEVEEVLRRDLRYKDLDAIHIDRITASYPVYIPDVQVFVLNRRDGPGQRIAVYRGGDYQRPVSDTLQGLIERGAYAPPPDARDLTPWQPPSSLRDVLSMEAIGVINAAFDADQSVRRAEAERRHAEDLAEEGLAPGERRSNDDYVRRCEGEVARACTLRDECIARVRVDPRIDILGEDGLGGNTSSVARGAGRGYHRVTLAEAGGGG